ncbi:MAG: alpha/beta hydrolase family protein [Acidobacteria bacterium]|nr:alpha/beta hydrolase family protein [Acidobacteriota bacterium]
MLSWLFHAWERRLAAVSKDRIVRPFEWGLEWLDAAGVTPDAPPAEIVDAWSATVMQDSDAFYHAPPTRQYHFDGDRLTFPSALTTPHEENNTVHARLFPALSGAARGRAAESKRAVLVLPQWNADADGHVGLARLLSRFGISALRLSLPYHDARMPPELTRADYIVSSNIVRTAQVCRQAVLDARRAIAWLASQGYERIGILGTSLGSCLAMLTAAHEPLIRAAALNHISPYFADVVWEGLSTAHVRQGLDGHIDLEGLRRMWLPISPFPFLDRVKDRKVLLVYARYDLSFPVRLSRMLVDEFSARGVDHEVAVLPCGHYSTGVAPFSWMDGYVLVRFLRKSL